MKKSTNYIRFNHLFHFHQGTMLHDATYKFMNNDIIQSSVSIKIAYKISDTPVTGRLAIVAARAVDMAPPKR